MSSVILKEKIRTLELADLIAIAVAVVNSISEVQAQRATGKGVLVPDGYLRVAYPDPSDVIMGAAVSGIIALAGANRPLDEFLLGWEREAGALTRHPAAATALAGIRKVLTASPGDVSRLYLNQGETQGVRFTAAVRMANDTLFDLDQMFIGHAALFAYVNGSLLKTEVGEVFGELVRKRWRERIRLPAVFLTPRYTIPPIKAACEDKATGLRLVARILLVAKDAVPSPPPPLLVHDWQRVAV
jgi:hypothetical protein